MTSPARRPPPPTSVEAAAGALLPWLDDMARFYDSVRPGGPVLASDTDIDGFRAAATALRAALAAGGASSPSAPSGAPSQAEAPKGTRESRLALLRSWIAEGDEAEQTETREALRAALGEDAPDAPGREVV